MQLGPSFTVTLGTSSPDGNSSERKKRNLRKFRRAVERDFEETTIKMMMMEHIADHNGMGAEQRWDWELRNQLWVPQEEARRQQWEGHL